MTNFIKLTNSQKEEIRSLTQFANRRIKAAENAYRKEGLEIAPREITGKHQIKKLWHTENTPISLCVRFTTQEEYHEQLNYLRTFEEHRPNLAEFTLTQRKKLLQEMESIMSSIGAEVPKTIIDEVEKMSAAQMYKFWRKFESKASKLPSDEHKISPENIEYIFT